MAVRPIVIWPDSRLREKTTEITDFGPATQELYRDLVDSMAAYEGIGIAAIQIGVTQRMFLLDSELCGREKGDPVPFINPQIVWTGATKDKSDEGCLSFPGIYVAIERPDAAKIKAFDLNGKEFELEGSGLLARAIQHEHDHLTGKLMIDFVGPLKKKMIKRKLEKRSESGHDHDHDHVHGENCQHD